MGSAWIKSRSETAPSDCVKQMMHRMSDESLAFSAQYPSFLSRQAINLILADTEVTCQQRIRIAPQPVRQRDLLIDVAVEQNQDFGGFIAGLLNKVPVALLDEGHMARSELFGL